MKVAVSTLGKYHAFDLARELHARGALESIFSGYPSFKLRNEQLPEPLIHSFPWVHGAYMALPWKNKWPDLIIRQWKYAADITFSHYVSHHLPDCDLYIGMSGTALLAGKKAHKRGIRFICDRGSAHIRVQNQLLREEHDSWGLDFSGIDERTIDREEAEYAEADLVTVPSTFAFSSFVEQGVQVDKLALLPYGVNVERFQPVTAPDENRFDILFVGAMSLQKGVQYLVQAYQKITHPAKSLTFVGSPSQALITLLQQRGLWPSDAKVLGHVPQAELKHIMSRSHVLVLPSIQDGFGMVLAQAMACACPVIASRHTGAEDLISDGCEGYIVPVRDASALAERLQKLVDCPELRSSMGAQALGRVHKMGGWNTYGEKAMAIYGKVLQS
ncbi:glycosyltransferase family 4 protein [Methylotenera sp.]|uniref:glycosyltransferase family 4 protein n=1 Tax=Methylotenera sp. TaxID=2051956 RepID=UPI00248867F4|nr:glycosyltransferase family 4 protein [Methylotenera sp.]MDI1299023.1 glycosyltransferase family 4 protein [Methylotenera sp.]